MSTIKPESVQAYCFRQHVALNTMAGTAYLTPAQAKALSAELSRIAGGIAGGEWPEQGQSIDPSLPPLEAPPLKRIGKGMFSTVYQREGSNFVYVVSSCYAKECMSMSWFDGGELFPTIEQVDSEGLGLNVPEGCRVYKMPYYDVSRSVLSKLDEQNKKLYRALRKLAEGGLVGYNNIYEAFSRYDNGLTKAQRNTLKDALNRMSDYGGDVCFEISPRNVAILGGKLVLLDCFFFTSQLELARS